MATWKLEETMSDDEAVLKFISDDGATWYMPISSQPAGELGQALVDFANGELYLTEGEL